MTASRLRRLAAGAALSLLAAPAFAATVVTGEVNATASAALVGAFADLPGHVDSHGLLLQGVPANFAAHAHAEAGDATPDLVFADTDVAASWANPNLGGITARTHLGVGIDDQIADQIVQATTIDQTPDHALPAWSYTFDATGDDDLFTMDVNVVVDALSTISGLGSWIVQVTRDSQSLTSQTLTFGAGPGHFTQALDVGHRYQVSLLSDDGFEFVTDGQNPNSLDGTQTSIFDWSITGLAAGAVPEPSAWALALLGFGLTGAALRRRPARRAA